MDYIFATKPLCGGSYFFGLTNKTIGTFLLSAFVVAGCTSKEVVERTPDLLDSIVRMCYGGGSLSQALDVNQAIQFGTVSGFKK